MEDQKPSDFTMDVRSIREQFGANLCARLLDVDVDAIHRWAAGGGTRDAQQRRRVADLRYIGAMFSGSGKPDSASNWMIMMNPSLDFDSPAEEIQRGRWVTAIAAARDYVGTA